MIARRRHVDGPVDVLALFRLANSDPHEASMRPWLTTSRERIRCELAAGGADALGWLVSTGHADLLHDACARGWLPTEYADAARAIEAATQHQEVPR